MKKETEKFIQDAREKKVISQEDLEFLTKFMNGEPLE